MTLKLRKEIFNKLIDGTKKSTSRLGERDVAVGNPIVFEMTEDVNVKYNTTVTEVFSLPFSELTEEEAKLEGYDSLKDLKSVLTKLYNPKENDIFTIIHFS